MHNNIPNGSLTEIACDAYIGNRCDFYIRKKLRNVLLSTPPAAR